VILLQVIKPYIFKQSLFWCTHTHAEAWTLQKLKHRLLRGTLPIQSTKHFTCGNYYVTLQESSNVTSYCDQTFPSWSHDVTLRHWACFRAHKLSPVPPKVHHDPFHNLTKVLCNSLITTIMYSSFLVFCIFFTNGII